MELVKEECANMYLNSYNFSRRYADSKVISDEALKANIPELSEFYEDLKFLYIPPADGLTDDDFFDFSRDYARKGFRENLINSFSSSLTLDKEKNRNLKYPALKFLSKNISIPNKNGNKIFFIEAVKDFIYKENSTNKERNLSLLRMIELNEFAHKASSEETLYEFLKNNEDSVAYHCNNLIFNDYSSYSYDLFENVKYYSGTIFSLIFEKVKAGEDLDLVQKYYSIKKEEVYVFTNIASPLNGSSRERRLMNKEPGVYLDYILRRIYVPKKHRIEFEIQEIKNLRKEIFRDTEKAKKYEKEAYFTIVQYSDELSNIFNLDTAIALGVIYNSEDYRKLNPYEQSKLHRLLDSSHYFSQRENNFEANIILYKTMLKASENIGPLLKLLVEIYDQKKSISFEELYSHDLSTIEITPTSWTLELLKVKDM